MLFNEEDKKLYEIEFNAYINSKIKGTFTNYLRDKRNKMECSLNELVDEDTEYLSLLVGEEDVELVEEVTADKLEYIATSSKIYRAIKPLTYEEKLTVFLCVILDKKFKYVAKMLGYARPSSAYKILNKALKKIRVNLERLENEE